MHALRVSGFSQPRADELQGEPVVVECWKVACEFSFRRTLRVPCLGGLAVSWILALCRDALSPPVFVDRGWCHACAAGGSPEHPLVGALNEARTALAACGVADHRLPRMQARPLPLALMPVAIPLPQEEQGLSRRGFLRTVLQKVAASTLGPVVPAEPEEVGATRTSARVFPAERLAQIHALSKIASRSGGEFPAELFPAIRVSARCVDHEVCARVCPSGALSAYEQGGTRGLRFDGRLCIACGQCQRSCPEQAIEAAPLPSRASLEPRTLTAHSLRECTDCGAQFPRRGAAQRCPACVKSRDCFAVFVGAEEGERRDAIPPQDRAQGAQMEEKWT